MKALYQGNSEISFVIYNYLGESPEKVIPKKNLKTVNGISLIERSIRTALKSKVDEIIVSTDDKEI